MTAVEQKAKRLDHIERATLPWRDERMTECGRAADDCASVLTIDEARAKFRDQGSQRAALSTCMTCASTADRWTTWHADPLSVMQRHSTHGRWDRSAGGDQLRRELRAIAALIEAHRDEFDEAVNGLVDAPDLSTVRSARRAAAAYRAGTRAR